MMDLFPGAKSIKRFWPLVLVVGLLSALVAFGASFLQSPSYSSATQVLVRARDIRFLSSTGQDPNARAGSVDLVQPRSLSQTLSGVVTGRAVAEQVVQELKLDQQSSSSGFGSAIARAVRAVPAYLQYGYYAEPDSYDSAVTRVQRGIEATPIKESYLIEIRARAASPQLAADIANAATRAFVDQNRQNFQTGASNYRTFLEGERDRARAEVTTAEAAISDYKQERGVSDVAEESKLSAASAEALRQQLRDVSSDLANAKAKRESLQSTLSGISPTERTTTTSQTSTSAPNGPNTQSSGSPATTDASQRQESVAPNRVFQELQRSLLALDGDIQGLEAKREVLGASVASMTQKAEALAQDAGRLSQLELQRTSAHNTFSTIQGAYEAALLNEAQGAEEVRQIDRAAPPLYPDRPIRYVFGFLGLMLGLAVGAAIAYVVDERALRLPLPTFATPRGGSASSARTDVATPVGSGSLDGAPRPLSDARRSVSRYEV